MRLGPVNDAETSSHHACQVTTGGIENGRPVTHLAYRSGETEDWFSPDPALLAELAPFAHAWEAA